MRIPIISSLWHYFSVFYSYAGKKLYLLCFIIFLGGLSEVVGVTMLLPILNFNEQGETQNSYTKIVYQFLETFGVSITLLNLLILLFIIFSFKSVFSFMQAGLSSYITTNLVKNLRVSIYQMYTNMEYMYYTKTNIGYLNNIITTEVDRAVSGLSKYIDVIVNMIFIVVYIASAFMINWVVTLLVLVVSAFVFVMLKKLSQIARQLSKQVSDTNGQIQSLLIQSIYNFKYLKATNSFTNLFKQVYKKIDENCNSRFKSDLASAIPISIVEPAAVFFLSGLILYQTNYNGKTIAEIMILLFFFYRAFTRVFSFQTVWQHFNARLGGVEVLETVTKTMELNKEIVGTRYVNQFTKSIELKNVNFKYGSKLVLSNINITIPRNSAIGIVGESGVGKTTLFDILTGLITPQSGSISIDGVDYKDVDLLSLRKIIGYVIQDSVTFNDTIANNISLWEVNGDDKNESMLQVVNSSKLANCEEFIDSSENGYETVIGDKGVRLSGGQRQRLAIARELFKKPEILIFDEATSSLDTDSEIYIQNSINSLIGKHAVVIIAHRLSTVKCCDHIYVLDNGTIIEEGSFGKLYSNKNSRFFSMCQAQNL